MLFFQTLLFQFFIFLKFSIIGVFGETGDWKRALSTFYEVKKEDRDSILYTTLLRTLDQNNRVKESIDLFEEMLLVSQNNENQKLIENQKIENQKNENQKNNENLKNNENKLIERKSEIETANYLKSKKMEQSIEKSSEIPKRGSVTVVPTIQMYTSIISVFGKNNDWERAYVLYQNMQRTHGSLLPLIPDKVLIFTMIRILEKAGQWDKAAYVKQKSLKYLSSTQSFSSFPPPSSSSSSSSSSISSSSSSLPLSSASSDTCTSTSPTTFTSPSDSYPSSSSTYSSTSFSTSFENALSPNFNELIREGRRSGDFRSAVAAADSWLALDR